MQISKFSIRNTAYPDQLRRIFNPPQHLYVRGTLPKDSLVAIVGTRKATDYGLKATYQISSGLAKTGAVIVSGLALGIDAMAHRAALDAGGRTVAVLASGLDQIYPSSNRALAEQILDTGGALVSEYEPGTPPLKYHFPERNRIIAGLCMGVMVTESPLGGGAMITVARAADAGRVLMAVPGNITSPSSAGPNSVLVKGGAPITSYTDAVTALGFHDQEEVPVPARSPQEAKLLDLIAKTGTTSDELIEASGLSAAEFANIISLMEITGKVRNLGAGLWVVR
jgi:DNA processing protein